MALPRTTRDTHAAGGDVVIHWALLVIVLVAAAWFAFGWPARADTMQQHVSWLAFVPFTVFTAIIAGILWLVRKATRVSADPRIA